MDMAQVAGLNCNDHMRLLFFNQSHVGSDKFTNDTKQSMLLQKLVFTQFKLEDGEDDRVSFLLLLQNGQMFFRNGGATEKSEVEPASVEYLNDMLFSDEFLGDKRGQADAIYGLSCLDFLRIHDFAWFKELNKVVLLVGQSVMVLDFAVAPGRSSFHLSRIFNLSTVIRFAVQAKEGVQIGDETDSASEVLSFGVVQGRPSVFLILRKHGKLLVLTFDFSTSAIRAQALCDSSEDGGPEFVHDRWAVSEAGPDAYAVASGQSVWLWQFKVGKCHRIFSYERYDRHVVQIIAEGDQMVRVYFNDCTQKEISLSGEADGPGGPIHPMKH